LTDYSGQNMSELVFQSGWFGCIRQ